MSLADELKAAQPKTPSPIGEWISKWYETLDAADKATWDQWVADPNAPITVMHRVLQRHGFPHGDSGLTKWIRTHRVSS